MLSLIIFVISYHASLFLAGRNWGRRDNKLHWNKIWRAPVWPGAQTRPGTDSEGENETDVKCLFAVYITYNL